MPKKTTSVHIPHPSSLKTWLFLAPLKFTGLLILLFGLGLVLSMALFGHGEPTAWKGHVMMTLFIAIYVFCIYKCIRFAPGDKLDRKSFVGLNIAQGVLSVVMLGLAAAVAVYLGVTPGIIPTTSSLIMSGIALVLLLFAGGVGILFFVSIYYRARMQEVSKSKLLLSLPFGFELFWYSGFLLEDARKPAPVLQTKSKILNSLSGWIVKNRTNTLIALGVMVVLYAMMMTSKIWYAIGFIVLSIIVASILLLRKGMRERLNHGFANFAVALNIGIIVAILSLAIFAPKTTQHKIVDQITITDTITQ